MITLTLRGNKMNKFKKGDKVNIYDGSYVFGIKNGGYSTYCDSRNDNRKNLTVVETGLSVVELRYKDSKYNDECHLSGPYSAVNDLLVTDNNGSFWFTQSRFCNPVEPNHHIVIDGKTIVLSHKSFLALREQLV